MMKQYLFVILSLGLLGLQSCRDEKKSALPYLGNLNIKDSTKSDSTFKGFEFELVNQDNKTITSKNLENKIYLASFIFLSCPTICPTINGELKKVYTTFKEEENLIFLSHTIDPTRDSIPRLKAYANKIQVKTEKWHFLRGDEQTVMNLAENIYFLKAYPDSAAPGGFAHSGGILLIDTKKNIRGVYNGIDTNETKRLINDISLLLKEEF